jgi:allantoin racemase
LRLQVIIPFPMDAAGVALREAQIPAAVRGEVEEVAFVPVRNSGLLADSFYEGLLMDAYIAAEGIHAEEAGFDAVIMDTVSDSGLEALRSRLSIPVVGPGQVSFHLAAMLGYRFSILSVWKGWEFVYRRNLRRYRMEDKLASLRSLDKVPDVDRLLSDDEDTIAALAREAVRAVEDDGADAVVMGSTTMYQAVPAVSDAVDVPVVNPGLWAFMLAVDLVKCGLSHSKRAYASPGTQQDEIFDGFPARDATASEGE